MLFEELSVRLNMALYPEFLSRSRAMKTGTSDRGIKHSFKVFSLNNE